MAWNRHRRSVRILDVLLVCVVTAAGVQDRDGAKPLLKRLREDSTRPTRQQKGIKPRRKG
jgi:hypothetical protein